MEQSKSVKTKTICCKISDYNNTPLTEWERLPKFVKKYWNRILISYMYSKMYILRMPLSCTLLMFGYCYSGLVITDIMKDRLTEDSQHSHHLILYDYSCELHLITEAASILYLSYTEYQKHHEEIQKKCLLE